MTFWRDYVPTIAESIYSETCSTEVPVRGGNSKTPINKTVVITSKDGDVLGSVIGAIRIADEAVGGEEVVEFLGIPYAKPPLGIYDTGLHKTLDHGEMNHLDSLINNPLPALKTSHKIPGWFALD